MAPKHRAPKGSAPSDGQNRRIHVREQLELPLTTTVRDRDRIVGAKALNISQGGAFVRTDDPWPIGTELQVTFEHDGVTHKATAVVVHQAVHNYERGVGVRFVDASDAFRRALRRIMANSPDPVR